MIASLNPPPVKIPAKLLNDPELAPFFRDMVQFYRLIFETTREIGGIETEASSSDSAALSAYFADLAASDAAANAGVQLSRFATILADLEDIRNSLAPRSPICLPSEPFYPPVYHQAEREADGAAYALANLALSTASSAASNLAERRMVTSDTTVTVGPTTEDYPTLKDALDDVEFWDISRNATLTISVTEGVYTQTVPIDLEVLGGGRILISCATPETLTFSSLVSVTSNGAGDHDVVWQVSSAANCSIGNWVNFRSLSGTGEYKTLAGCWQITAVDTGANQITVKIKDRRASIGACTVSAATIKRLKVNLQFNGSVGIIARGTFGEGSSAATGIKNAAITGNGTSFFGVLVEYGSHLDLSGDCGIANFGSHGLYGIYGASVGAQNVCVSGCGSNGVYALNGSVIQFVGGVATGNVGSGIVASVGSQVAASTANASGNATGVFSSGCSSVIFASGSTTGNTSTQIFAENEAYISATSAIVVSTSSYGVRSRHNSDVDFTSGTVSGSSTADIYAEFKSLVRVTSASYGTLSPALETIGNMESLISNDTSASSNVAVEGTRNFLGAVTVLPPTSSLHAATKAYVDSGDTHSPLVNAGGLNFDGATTYLDGSALTGIADGKLGSAFLVVRFANAASATEFLTNSTGSAFRIFRTSTGNIQVAGENSAGTTIISFLTTGTPCAAAGTYLIGVSFDLNSAGTSRICINDVSYTPTEATYTNDTIDYTATEYSVGASESGGNKLNGDLYALWFDATQRLDWSQASVRRRFHDANLVPTFLGGRGELPTGSQPVLYLGMGGADSWWINRGYGSGNFVRNGTIAAATTALSGQYMASRQGYMPPFRTTETTLTLAAGVSYTFTGSSAATWTLPAVAGNHGLPVRVKNAGSANVVVQRAGSDNIYDNASVTSVVVRPGASRDFHNDASVWQAHGARNHTLNVNTTGVGNVGTGEDNLITYSLVGGTLAADGDSVVVEMGGTFAASVNNKQLKFYFGATVVLDTGALAITLAGSWYFRMTVTRTGAATQKISAMLNTSQAAMLANASYVTAAETLSGAVTIKATGTATSNDDVRQETLSVAFVNGA